MERSDAKPIHAGQQEFSFHLPSSLFPWNPQGLSPPDREFFAFL